MKISFLTFVLCTISGVLAGGSFAKEMSRETSVRFEVDRIIDGAPLLQVTNNRSQSIAGYYFYKERRYSPPKHRSRTKRSSTPEPCPDRESPSRRVSVLTTREVTVTAYTSRREETDDSPHTTASGTKTRCGVVAMNGYKIGTRVRFPNLFGDKTFVVEDRKHRRYASNWADIWFPSLRDALKFGIKKSIKMEVVYFR
ncbi:MAG: hypothetical protein O2794_03915 [bacterium]|nr:hypothetical protein [bacterium]